MRWAATAAIGLVGCLLWAGCREQPAQLANEQNLGEKPGEVLMPVAAPPADPRVLMDQSQVTEPTFSAARRAERPAEGTEQEGAADRTRSKASAKTAKEGGAEGATKSLADLVTQAQPKKEEPATSQPASAPTSAAASQPARIIEQLSFSLPAPWKTFKPTGADGLVIAYVQKGVGEVGVFSFEYPKELDPAIAQSDIGRSLLPMVLQKEAKKRFETIDKWTPGARTIDLQGAKVIETRCSLKKGPIAEVEDTGEATCLGIAGKTRGYLIVYRIPTAGAKKAVTLGKEILGAIQVK